MLNYVYTLYEINTDSGLVEPWENGRNKILKENENNKEDKLQEITFIMVKIYILFIKIQFRNTVVFVF
jgi:hypothetical protein